MRVSAASWAVVILATVLAFALGSGLLKLGFDQDPRVYFGPDSSERRALADIETRHAPSRSAVVVISSDNGRIYSADALMAVAELTGLISVELPDARLTSLSTLRVPGVTLGNAAAIDSIDGERLAEWVSANPVPVQGLVADDGSATAILVEMPQAPAETEADAHRTIEAIIEMVAADHQGLTLGLTGDIALDATFTSAVLGDLIKLVPFQVILMVLLILVALQSIWATVALLAVLTVATLSTMGFAAWTGHTLNGVTAAVPTVLLGLSVATSIHIILAWQQALRTKKDREEALAHAIEINLVPVTLATVTTLLSFLCLNFSTSPPFRQFGNFVAGGLVLTLILSFTLLPALLRLIPPAPAKRRHAVEDAIANLGATVLRWRRPLILLFLLAIPVSAYGISAIHFDDRFTRYFDESYPFRQATDRYEASISGITRLYLSIPARTGEALSDPSYLSDVSELIDHIAGAPKLVQIASLLDITQAVSSFVSAMAENGVPETEAAGAAAFSLAGRTPDGRTALSRFVDESGDHGLVTFIMRDASSTDVLGFAAKVERFLTGPEIERSASVAGLPVLSAHLAERNTRAMLIGTAVALATISMILVLTLRSLRYGLVSLVPNLLPLAIAYGFWGFAFREVSFAATMVSAMTLGIVVDDTVHVLAKYRRFRRVDGLSTDSALIESFRTVGVAVIVTTLAISLGFLVLAQSGFLVNQHLGLLTAVTLAAALVTVLAILPPLVHVLDSGRETGSKQDNAKEGPDASPHQKP